MGSYWDLLFLSFSVEFIVIPTKQAMLLQTVFTKIEY